MIIHNIDLSARMRYRRERGSEGRREGDQERNAGVGSSAGSEIRVDKACLLYYNDDDDDNKY